MPDVISLSEARAAIRLPVNDTSKDTQLEETYIPAVTAVIEDLLGPIMLADDRTYVSDGGSNVILLPWLNIASIESIVESGTTLTEDDYVANLPAGIIYRGTTDSVLSFMPGQQSVTVTYTAGIYADSTEVPYNIKLAARIILAQLWQADQQGYRPDFGTPDTSLENTPAGYAIPRRAKELLGRASNRPLGVR